MIDKPICEKGGGEGKREAPAPHHTSAEKAAIFFLPDVERRENPGDCRGISLLPLEVTPPMVFGK